MRLGYLSVLESRGQRGYLDGMCTEKTWDSLSIKKNNDCDYKVLNKKISRGFAVGGKRGTGREVN